MYLGKKWQQLRIIILKLEHKSINYNKILRFLHSEVATLWLSN